MLEKYSSEVGSEHKYHIFLCGDDCYALRCAILHEGNDNIMNQRSKELLDYFHFVVPKEGWCIHCNQKDTGLQLQVDIFCSDICDGVEKWIKDMKCNKNEIYKRFDTLLKIDTLDNDISF